jgi:hypothetical protein
MTMEDLDACEEPEPHEDYDYYGYSRFPAAF